MCAQGVLKSHVVAAAMSQCRSVHAETQFIEDCISMIIFKKIFSHFINACFFQRNGNKMQSTFGSLHAQCTGCFCVYMSLNVNVKHLVLKMLLFCSKRNVSVKVCAKLLLFTFCVG